MNFDDLWEIIEKKNPNLVTDKEIKMTVKGFRKAVKLAFDKGYEQGIAQGFNDGNNALSAFEQIFGKNKY